MVVTVPRALALEEIIQEPVFSTIQTSRNAVDAYMSVTFTTRQFIVLPISTGSAAVRYVSRNCHYAAGLSSTRERQFVSSSVVKFP